MKLELRGVSCGYNKGRSVLENVNFTVETGEICVLLGPNGVGKSTLFKSILFLIPPQGGDICIDNEDISRWSYSKRAEYMSYVSQFHVPPFPYEVKDVVLLGRLNSVGYFGQPTKDDYDIAEAAMEDMGVLHLRDKPYTEISGGERQLVMIARALAQEPAFLIMDEPTANLDYGNMVKVINKIRSLKSKGLGVIMTTHWPDQAFMCESNVVLLQRHNPLLFGTATNIITERNLKEAYGVDVNVVEYFSKNGRLVRLCSPQFND
ncbi:MAG: ABC transporter ATP-binding protein [Clostridiales bacterium]|nr:ABC transporter ATP-binding protein [Clostridiales bacterium]